MRVLIEDEFDPSDPYALTAYGKRVVADGKLEKLRLHLGLSRNAMAELLHTSPVTYTSWEIYPTKTRLWSATAQRIGAFYRAAQAELRLHGADPYRPLDLVPFHMVATLCGIPQELLLRWYRDGTFEAVDLGILGLWVTKDEMRNKLTVKVS
jgi:hypothetical protein